MPYIKNDFNRREALADNEHRPGDPGELNYLLTYHVLKYLGGSTRYADINEVIGVLECMKLELYRRVAAPYEDKKCAENGDVYE